MSTRLRKLPVPEVVGLDQGTAEKVVKLAGFAGVRIHYVESYEDQNIVVDQAPRRGSLLGENEVVTLFVAKMNLVRFLPAIYQPSSPDDKAFLRDFLWIVQHVLDGISRKIDSIHELFHPYTVPADFLPWLASWFAIAFDENMPEEKRRKVIREAPSLYAIRGTVRAIKRLIKLFVGLDCEIIENCWPYDGMRVGVSCRIGVNSMVLHEVSKSNTFIVKLPVGYEDLDQTTLVRLHHLIQAEKPASSNYFLQFADKEGVTEDISLFRIGLTAIGLVGEEAVKEPQEQQNG